MEILIPAIAQIVAFLLLAGMTARLIVPKGAWTIALGILLADLVRAIVGVLFRLVVFFCSIPLVAINLIIKSAICTRPNRRTHRRKVRRTRYGR